MREIYSPSVDRIILETNHEEPFKRSDLRTARFRRRIHLGGGVAIVLHGIERMTLDLDIALNLTQANVDTFLEVMDENSMIPRVPVSGNALSDPTAVEHMIKEKNTVVFSFIDPDEPLKQVDVFLRAELQYNVLEKDSMVCEFEGREVRVISPGELLQLKKAIDPPRSKDVFDIAELRNLIDSTIHFPPYSALSAEFSNRRLTDCRPGVRNRTKEQAGAAYRSCSSVS